MDDRKMFFGASAKIFELAKENRNDLTVYESKIWSRLRDKQLGVRFRSQHPIGKFIADFYCHKWKLVIEIDGGYHESKEQKLIDQNRDQIMENYGLTVLRFTNKEIDDNIDEVVKKINSRPISAGAL